MAVSFRIILKSNGYRVDVPDYLELTENAREVNSTGLKGTTKTALQKFTSKGGKIARAEIVCKFSIPKVKSVQGTFYSNTPSYDKFVSDVANCKNLMEFISKSVLTSMQKAKMGQERDAEAIRAGNYIPKSLTAKGFKDVR